MNTSRQLFYLIILFSFFSISAMAQQSSVLPDSVVIRDNRMQLPFQLHNRNISILNRDQIKQLPVKSVNELLTYAAGLDIRQRGPWGGQADISIDGSTFDQVLVLVNGVKLSDPQTGHNMMNLSIPLSAIERIEILRGPAARVYGVNALAGAVNIVTTQPRHNEISAQIYAGSNFQTDTTDGKTYFGAGMQATASLVEEKHTHIISAAHDEGNGYRYNTAYKADKLFYQNRIRMGVKDHLDAFGAYSRNHFGANGYYSSPGDIESEETLETALGSIAYSFYPGERIKLVPKISYRYSKDNYIYNRQKPDLYHNIHETNTVTGELQSNIRAAGGTIGLGAEWRNEQINSSNLGKNERYNMGVYAEYSRLFLERLNVSAGLYANYNSDYNWQVFPGIDAGFRITDHWKISAAFTTGQRLPTYTDLYYKGPLNIGNDQLKPELSTYWEACVHYRHPFMSWKGSYFYRHVSDLIDWVRGADTLPWQPQNFQKLNTSGWTTEFNYQLSRQLGLAQDYLIDLSLSYTYLDQEIQTTGDFLSKYSIEALRHKMAARLNTTLFEKLSINATCRYQQRINYSDYTIIDLRLAYQLKHWKIYADLNNLSDTQYKEIGTVQMPGRWITAGMQLVF